MFIRDGDKLIEVTAESLKSQKPENDIRSFIACTVATVTALGGRFALEAMGMERETAMSTALAVGVSDGLLIRYWPEIRQFVANFRTRIRKV